MPFSQFQQNTSQTCISACYLAHTISGTVCRCPHHQSDHQICNVQLCYQIQLKNMHREPLKMVFIPILAPLDPCVRSPWSSSYQLGMPWFSLALEISDVQSSVAGQSHYLQRWCTFKLLSSPCRLLRLDRQINLPWRSCGTRDRGARLCCRGMPHSCFLHRSPPIRTPLRAWQHQPFVACNLALGICPCSQPARNTRLLLFTLPLCLYVLNNTEPLIYRQTSPK